MRDVRIYELVTKLFEAVRNPQNLSDVVSVIVEISGANSGALVGRYKDGFPFKVLAMSHSENYSAREVFEDALRSQSASSISANPFDNWVNDGDRQCLSVGDRAFYLLLDNVADQDHELITIVVSYLAKIVDLSNFVSDSMCRNDVTQTVLDAAPIGMCILEDNSVVIKKNKAAAEILDGNSIIRLTRNGDLTARNSDIKHRIRQAVLDVARGYCISRTLSLSCADGHEKLLLEVNSCEMSSACLFGQRGYACMTIVDPARPFPLSVEKLRGFYKLSGAEICVTKLLMLGYTCKEMARSRGVSPETIRSQLKSIGAKTGINSRVELACLVYQLCWQPNDQVRV